MKKQSESEIVTETLPTLESVFDRIREVVKSGESLAEQFSIRKDHESEKFDLSFVVKKTVKFEPPTKRYA